MAVDKPKFSAVDLFAGAGGFSCAALSVGIDVRAAIEYNHHACRTYSENIKNKNPGLQVYEANILNLSPEQVIRDAFDADKSCDILLGGPPCQGFSVHRIKDAGVDDPRNTLILRYFKFVETLRPKVFLMENVPGMLWKRHEKYLNEFYEEGDKAGYDIKAPIIIDARDYGVPQRRKRVFVLGVRRGIDLNLEWPPLPSHGNFKQLKTNLGLKPWRIAGEVFEKPFSLDDPNNIHMNHTQIMIDRLAEVPLNGGSRKDTSWELPCHKEHNGHKDVYGRIDPTQPGPTMTTACVNPSKGRFVHPTENHGITVRHAARFQTFPDNFIFYGGLMAAGAQVGNAVPVRLGEVLLTEIMRGLERAR
jgi:DNA (cytosine-5)-methyltransferase 1